MERLNASETDLLSTALSTGILTEMPVATSVLQFGNEVSEGMHAVLASYKQF